MQAILEGIVSRTNTKQGPGVPQVTTLRPVVAAESDLPVFVDAPPDGKVGLVFCAGRCLHVPQSESPLIVCLRPLPDYGFEQDGVFSGAIVVYVWQHPDYPLSPKEVEWSIAHDCGCENHAWSELPLCWKKLNEIVHDDLQDLKAQYAAQVAAGRDAVGPDTAGLGALGSKPVNGPPAAPLPDKTKKKRKAGVSHRGSGRPRKPSTFHLLDQMRTLPSDRLYDFHPFFPGWLHVYEDKEGRTPPYPEDLFRQAALACAERILKERGEK